MRDVVVGGELPQRVTGPPGAESAPGRERACAVDEEPGCVGRLARPSERARGERWLPACGRQCASERATCAEPPRGKKKSAETSRPIERRTGGRRRRSSYQPASEFPIDSQFSSVC